MRTIKELHILFREAVSDTFLYGVGKPVVWCVTREY